MTSRITIPFSTLSELDTATLDLFPPDRCSRCNARTVDGYETHPLKYQAGYTRFRTLTRKFGTSLSFKVRLPLCEQCRMKNFIEAPETMTHDIGSLGRLARLRAAGINAGALISGATFILLMKLIPLPSSPIWLHALWLYLIGICLVILFSVFGLTLFKNSALEKELINQGFDIQLHRARIIASVQYEKPQPDDTAVTVDMENDVWAEECARNHGWKYERMK